MKSKSISVKVLSFLCLLLLVLTNGCRTAPLTASNIEGEYKPRGEGWTAYEWITLHDGIFRWVYVTERPNGPEPRNGVYTLNGNVLTLHNPLLQEPERVLKWSEGVCLMWTAKDIEKFSWTGQTPNTVLYQSR